MASQQPAPRQWFRLPSIIRPVLPATQTPEPRPPMRPPAFRPRGPQPLPTQSPEPAPAPTFVSGVSSVPSSPIKRTSAPSSPVQKTTTSTVLPATTTTSAVTSPPKPQVSDTSASLISSPPSKPSPSPPKPSTSSLPTSPAKRLPTSPGRPVLTSPPKPVPTSPARPVVTTTVLPRPSPRTLKPAVQSPPESPKTRPTAPPPSPLILPPPQLSSKAEVEPKIQAETEQKTVLVQTTTEKPKSWLNGTGHHNDFDERHKHSSGHHGKHELSKDNSGKKEKGHRKAFASDSDEASMRVITIAGENKGAFMEVIKSPMKHNFGGNSHTLHPQNETKWHRFGSSSRSSSEEGNSKKDKSKRGGKAMHSPPMGAFTNSNVQGVNNSILLNSSCSHHDPGVHLSLSRKPIGPGIHVEAKTNGHQS